MQGSTGTQGIQGLTGLDGIQGPQGETGLDGIQGPQGDQGPQGETGVDGIQGPQGDQGPQGETGIDGIQGPQGDQGSQGETGVDGIQGPQGDQGPQGETGVDGIQGPQGDQGPQGETGVDGIQGPQGDQGFQGETGIDGIQGPQGDTGLGVQGYQGETGLQGVTGPEAPTENIVHGIINRYQAETKSGAEVWVTSSGVLYTGLSWTRSGTTLTVNRNSHGHAVGDMVILRNTNVDYNAAPISAITANSFDILVSSTGGALGSSGRYSMGFIFAHDVGLTGGTLAAPSGSEVQLISMKLRTGQRAGSTYNLTVPASVINGAGENTDLSDVYIPIFSVRTDSDTLAAIAATIAVNQGLGYSTFTFGNLGSGTLSRFILLQF
jgi:hypothetical protein